MTPEEIEELRALNGDNMAAIIGAAREHIHKQDARIAELEGDLEQEEHNSEAFMNKIGEHVCEIVDLETKIAELEASLDEAAALTKKNAEQINALLAQVAALREIAIEEVAIRIAYENNMSPAECREYSHCQARRQLSEEHPEVDWK